MYKQTTDLYEQMRAEAQKHVKEAINSMISNAVKCQVDKHTAQSIINKLVSNLDLIILKYGVLQYEESFRRSSYQEIKRVQSYKSLLNKIEVVKHSFYDAIYYTALQDWTELVDTEPVEWIELKDTEEVEEVKEDYSGLKTYEIYDLNTDEKLGEVEAYNVDDAEYKAWGIFKGVEIYALTKEGSD